MPRPEIEIIRNDITTIPVQAIVNPVHTEQLWMAGSVATAIADSGGPGIEKAATKHAPVPVGEAVRTAAGDLPCDYVIHAPVMAQPTDTATVEGTRKATAAALRCADGHEMVEVALPGMGTAAGHVSADEAAEAMVDVIMAFDADHLTNVVLVAYGDELYNAFHAARRAAQPDEPRPTSQLRE